jgi:membrane-associated phospholipid phosphatase
MGTLRDSARREAQPARAQAAVQVEHTQPRVAARHALFVVVWLAVALAAFLALALWATGAAYSPFDVVITQFLQSARAPAFARFMEAVSAPGNGPEALILASLLIVAVAVAGLRWEATVAALAALLSYALAFWVKEVVRRPRPAAPLVEVFQKLANYSFPSGHVLFYTGFYGFLAYLAFVRLKPSPARTVLVCALLAAVALVGPSRIYLGEHWASDVLGGYLLGSIIVLVAAQAYQWGRAHLPGAAQRDDH